MESLTKNQIFKGTINYFADSFKMGHEQCMQRCYLTLNLVSFQVWSLFYPLKLNRYITGLFQTRYSKLVEFYPICSASEHQSNL